MRFSSTYVRCAEGFCENILLLRKETTTAAASAESSDDDDSNGNTFSMCGIAADLGLDSPNVAQSCIATRPYHL